MNNNMESYMKTRLVYFCSFFNLSCSMNVDITSVPVGCSRFERKRGLLS